MPRLLPPRALVSGLAFGLVLGCGTDPDPDGTTAASQGSAASTETGTDPTGDATAAQSDGPGGTSSGGPATSTSGADSTSGGEPDSPEDCAPLTNQEDCEAEVFNVSDEGPRTCTWAESTLITDAATCAGEAKGRCIADYYLIADGCGDPEPLPACGDIMAPDGLVWFDEGNGIEVVTWTVGCSTPPGTPCDFEGDDLAAQACNCMCQ